MEESKKNSYVENGGDKEILYSKAIKAGKRIYYIDVKKSSKDDLFIAITESKRVQQGKGHSDISFEKHKIFLYKEDFDRFANTLKQVMDYANKYQLNQLQEGKTAEEHDSSESNLSVSIDDFVIEPEEKPCK